MNNIPDVDWPSSIQRIFTKPDFDGPVTLLAVLVKADYRPEHKEGKPTFFTNEKNSLQLGASIYKKGEGFNAHYHPEVKRLIPDTQEVLYVKRGTGLLTIYGPDKQLADTVAIQPGDIIILITGGHGMVATEDMEIREVKQGPYLGDRDKIKWTT